MASPRISNRLASKRKVMEEEGIDVPWKALMTSKAKKQNPTPEKQSPVRKNGPSVRQKKLTPRTTENLVEEKRSTNTNDINGVHTAKKSRPASRRISTPSEYIAQSATSAQDTSVKKSAKQLTNEQYTTLEDDVFSSQKLDEQTLGVHVENPDAQLEIGLDSTSGTEDKNAAEVVTTEGGASVELLISRNHTQIETVPVDAVATNEEEAIPISDRLSTSFDSADPESNNETISAESHLESSSSCLITPQVQTPTSNVTSENTELVTVENLSNEDSATDTISDIHHELDANVESHTSDGSAVRKFTIEGQMGTPVRNALLDIIMKRQQLKEDNNDSLVAATIPQEDVPPGSMEEIQDVLGWVAMESNVEFMLTDKLVLVYGSWHEVEKARKKLSEFCKQRKCKEDEQGKGVTETLDANMETTASAAVKQETATVVDQITASEPIEGNLMGLPEFSGGSMEENSIVLEMVEPTDEEGQRELEESGVKSLLDNHGRLYSRGSMFRKNPEKACFTCTDCGFKSTKQGVAKHRMRFHNDLQHSCIVCGQTFGMRYDMRRHRLGHFDIEGNLLSKAYPLWSAVNSNMDPVHLRGLEKGFQVNNKAKTKDCSAEKSPQAAASDLAWMVTQIKEDENNEKSSDEVAEAEGETTQVEEDAAELVEADIVHVVQEGDSPASGETKVVYVVQNKKQDNAVCNICSYVGSVAAVRKHCERQHPLISYECPLCRKRCGVVNDMQKHLQGHPEYQGSTDSKAVRNLAVCEQCNFSGESRVVKIHGGAEHGFSLQYTEITESVPRSLKFAKDNTMQAQGNITLPRDSERFACEICGKEILLSRYKHHMKSHDESWKCDLCGFSSRNKTMLLQHKQKQHNEGYLNCNECDKKFATEGSLKFHMSSIHNREASRVVCGLCNKIFATERFLKVHIQRIHQNIKRYFCDICNKGFYEKVRMLEHRVVHGSEEDKDSIKKWKCSFCERKFRTRFCAKQHENCHTGDKPFKCSHCTRTFAWKSEAQKHEVSVHTDGTLYNCPDCGRGFKFQYKLNAHMVLHNKSTKNMCSKCGKCFTMASTLRKHNCKPLLPRLVISMGNAQEGGAGDSEEGADSGVEYLCGLCNKSFESVEHIVAHMSEDHAQETQNALLGASGDAPLVATPTVAMETQNIEMMYIPKDEEMIVVGQNSETLNSDIIQETVTITEESYQYNQVPNSQLLQVDTTRLSQDHNYLKEHLVSDDIKVITDQNDDGTVEIVIGDGNISDLSGLPANTQLVIVDEHAGGTLECR